MLFIKPQNKGIRAVTEHFEYQNRTSSNCLSLVEETADGVHEIAAATTLALALALVWVLLVVMSVVVVVVVFPVLYCILQNASNDGSTNSTQYTVVRLVASEAAS